MASDPPDTGYRYGSSTGRCSPTSAAYRSSGSLVKAEPCAYDRRPACSAEGLGDLAPAVAHVDDHGPTRGVEVLAAVGVDDRGAARGDGDGRVRDGGPAEDVAAHGKALGVRVESLPDYRVVAPRSQPSGLGSSGGSGRRARVRRPEEG